MQPSDYAGVGFVSFLNTCSFWSNLKIANLTFLKGLQIFL